MGGLILIPISNASAVLKYYTSGTHIQTGSTYTGAWDGGQNTYAAPLRLSGSETVYSGTNITLLGATQYNAASQRGALVENGA
ncbi:MAG: hypothetical protein LBD30_06215, partial [Verrucomicrobiales bacterium]|nr:hypothetical protein [Verrucomicrobiales bacterium]